MKTTTNKSDNNRKPSLEKLHQEVISWKSKIDFIHDEMQFLEHLLSSKYIDCLSSGLFKKIEISTKKISEEKKDGNTLLKSILKHNTIISKFIKNNNSNSYNSFLETHKKFTVEIDNFIKKYKRLKKQIFNSIEKVMTKKEQKKLI